MLVKNFGLVHSAPGQSGTPPRPHSRLFFWGAILMANFGNLPAIILLRQLATVKKSCLFGSRRKDLIKLAFERTCFFCVYPVCAFDVEGPRDCEFLFASTQRNYFRLRGGFYDCVLVGGRIRSAGVAQFVAFRTPSTKPGGLCGLGPGLCLSS
jgi:hypothetical protein